MASLDSAAGLSGDQTFGEMPFASDAAMSGLPNYGDINSAANDAASTINIPATTDSSSTSGDTGGLSSILSNIGSSIGGSLVNTIGGIASNAGTLAEYGGLYDLISKQASGTQKQNNTLAGQIGAIGQPDVTAGTNLLNSYTQGNLTAPFQAQVDTAKAQNAKNATSQTQQVAQLLANSGGGQNVQSALAGETGQIQDQQALADQQAMSTAFANELSSSLNLTSTGGQYVMNGIQQEIASNSQLQQQLSDLMGTLAQAFALQTSSIGSGGGSGGVGGSGSKTGGASSTFGGIINSLFGKGVSSGVNAGVSSLLGGGLTSADVAGDVASIGDGSSVLGGQSASDILSSVDDSILGGSSASSGAAAAGASTAAGAADAAGTGLTAADLGISGAGTTGLTSESASSIADAVSSANLGGNAAAGTASGLSTGLGAAGAIGIGALTVGEILNNVTGSHSVSINNVSPGQSGITLPSGQSALVSGNMARGAGNNASQGSGQWFVMQGGKPVWVGAQNDRNIGLSLMALSGVTRAQWDLMHNGSSVGMPARYQPTAADKAAGVAKANSVLQGIYNQYGGQSGLGVDFNTWITQMRGIQGNMSGSQSG